MLSGHTNLRAATLLVSAQPLLTMHFKINILVLLVLSSHVPPFIHSFFHSRKKNYQEFLVLW